MGPVWVQVGGRYYGQCHPMFLPLDCAFVSSPGVIYLTFASLHVTLLTAITACSGRQGGGGDDAMEWRGEDTVRCNASIQYSHCITLTGTKPSRVCHVHGMMRSRCLLQPPRHTDIIWYVLTSDSRSTWIRWVGVSLNVKHRCSLRASMHRWRLGMVRCGGEDIASVVSIFGTYIVLTGRTREMWMG